MKNKPFNPLHFGQALGREEMKKMMAGSGSGGNCWLECSNCNNSTCMGNVPNCTKSTIYQYCGLDDDNYQCDCFV